jgi:hypothetical protein
MMKRRGGIEPAFDEIVDQGLHRRRVCRRSLKTRSSMVALPARIRAPKESRLAVNAKPA